MTRNARWNMTVHILDVSFYLLADSLVSALVVVPAFLLELGASSFLVALLPSLRLLCMNLPQAATSYYAERRVRQKPWILVTGITQRLPFLLIPLLALAWGKDHPQAVVAVIVLGTVMTAGSFGLTAPAWSELIAKSIPENQRGMFMGAIVMLGSGMGALGGLVVARVLASGNAFPSNYVTLYLMAAGVMVLSYVSFALNREPVGEPPRNHVNLRTYLKGLPAVLRDDRSFAWFVVYQALAHSMVVGMGLFMVFAVKAHGVTDQQTGAFIFTSMLAMMVASPLLGRVADVLGHRSVLGVGQVAYALAALLVIVIPDVRVMFAAFALLSIATACQAISARNFVYQLAAIGRRPTYVALFGALPAPAALGFSLLAGWLSKGSTVGCLWAFGLSAFVSLVAAAVLWIKVHPRRPEPSQHGMAGMDIKDEVVQF